ncbi:MAG: DUF3368 domain-containing protein [Gammaproteobacteria bacterium]|nr:DUF3368 domain-containing protein [Gammaproteobacteria bacterium]
MIIVLNTTPLISLAAIDQLLLLQQLVGEVHIPQAVYEEIKAKQSFACQEVDAAWIRVTQIKGKDYLGLLLNDLDRGEAEAILLAKELCADALVIDERMGYQIALSQGITAIGTLTILLMAKKAGLIDAVKPLLDDMISAGRWYSDAVYQIFLQDIGELR